MELEAKVYKNERDDKNELEIRVKIMKKREEKLGKEHPSTATSYHNIGSVFKSKGEYDKALEYYFKCLKIREEK